MTRDHFPLHGTTPGVTHDALAATPPKERGRYRRACLFLGHNAAAMVWNDANDLFAIEDEKESRAKGGEYVPLHMLLQLSRYDLDEVDVINFLGDVDYSEVIRALCGGDRARFEDFRSRTRLHELKVNHHATHAINGALEAWVHERQAAAPQGRAYHVLITDGTGDDYEATSVYTAFVDPLAPLGQSIASLQRVRRIPASDLSCGLLFARLVCNADTGFAPLKDEYKSLGYETAIDKVLDHNARSRLDRIVDKVVASFFDDRPRGLKRALREDIASFLPGLHGIEPPQTPPGQFERKPVLLHWDADKPTRSILDIRHRPTLALRGSAEETQHLGHGLSVRTMQDMATRHVPMPACVRRHLASCDRFQIRVLASYVANRFIEHYAATLLKREHVENLIVGGGVHFNVKLNNVILNSIGGKLCCAPLAGDVVHAATGAVLLDPSLATRSTDLLLLKRDLAAAYRGDFPENVVHLDDPEAFLEIAARQIAEGQLVNIVKDWGELGPRALLANSTLCLPTEALKNRVNLLNGRDDYMPMAPVLRQESLRTLFVNPEVDRIVGSLHGMIVALTYRDDVPRDRYAGVMHFMNDGRVTGRPMVATNAIDRELLRRVEVLSGHQALINTSFNVHGKSTVQRLRHAYADFDYQCRNADALALPRPLLIVCTATPRILRETSTAIHAEADL